MHELALTQSVMETVLAEAEKHRARVVNRVKLLIGEFTGVARESLEFCFEVVKRGTLAESALLEIEMVPLVKNCPNCHSTLETEQAYDFLCPRCGGQLEIVSGRELQIEYIDLD